MKHHRGQRQPLVGLLGLRSTMVGAMVAWIVTAAVPGVAWGQRARALKPGASIDTALSVGASHDYTVRLRRGESVDLIVRQRGVDVVIEVAGPPGETPYTVDSPTGRTGDEVVEIIARGAATYRLRIRPYDGREPAGRYQLEVASWRDARVTAALMRSRELAREAAARWLAPRTSALSSAADVVGASLPALDSLAARVQVMGIGEATHGSREFGELRVALTRRLVERNGYRVVAIEGSATRLAGLNRYIRGAGPRPRFLDNLQGDPGWIGVRPQRELVTWLRQWNLAHPGEAVTLVGVDPQDAGSAPDSLRVFLGQVYGARVDTALAPMFRELVAADSQVLVFGNSDVDSSSHAAIFSVLAKLEMDRGLLSKKTSAAATTRAIEIARDLAQFADFNSGGEFPASRSRDWYMASNLLSALDRVGSRSKTVFWAHNAHIAHPTGQSVGSRSSGGWMREALGCGYAALGVTFGEGGFVAQIPNDSAARLAISSLPPAPAESIEGVLSRVSPGVSLSTWPCVVDSTSVPAWLRVRHPMHWVGGLWAPQSLPSEAFQPYNLITDFDGIVYMPRVTADEMPANRPVIPARRRQ